MLALSDKDIPRTISTSYGEHEQTGNGNTCIWRYSAPVSHQVARHVIETDVLRLAFSTQRLRSARLQGIREAQ